MPDVITPAAGAADTQTPATPSAPSEPQSNVSDIYGDPKAKEGSDPSKPEGDGSEPDAGKTGDEGEAKKSENRVPAKVRIARITGQRNEARVERDAFRDRAERAEANLAKLQKQMQNPDLSFDERESLRMREAIQTQNLEDSRAEEQSAGQRVDYAGANEFFARVEADESMPADFLDKFGKTPVSAAMTDMLIESEKGPQLALYLANNVKTAEEIYRLTESRNPGDRREGERRLLKIEAGLQAAKPRTVSKAPDPGTRLSGGTPPSPKSLEEEDDQGAYNARRHKMLAERNRR